MSGSSILASVWLSEGEVWELDDGRPRYVVKVAGRKDRNEGSDETSAGDMLFVGILRSGALDLSQCILALPRVGGGYTLYLLARSAA
jgi:hypothetical protein